MNSPWQPLIRYTGSRCHTVTLSLVSHAVTRLTDQPVLLSSRFCPTATLPSCTPSPAQAATGNPPTSDNVRRNPVTQAPCRAVARSSCQRVHPASFSRWQPFITSSCHPDTVPARHRHTVTTPSVKFSFGSCQLWLAVAKHHYRLATFQVLRSPHHFAGSITRRQPLTTLYRGDLRSRSTLHRQRDDVVRRRRLTRCQGEPVRFKKYYLAVVVC